MMDNLNEKKKKKIKILSGGDIKIVLTIKIYSSYMIEVNVSSNDIISF